MITEYLRNIGDGWAEGDCYYCGDSLLFAPGENITIRTDRVSDRGLGVVCEQCKHFGVAWYELGVLVRVSKKWS